jgi:hypothetical protein
MKNARRRAALLLCVLLLLVLPAQGGGRTCSRIVAVGDLHGAFEPFVEILVRAEILTEDLQWAGGEACLVQLGDLVDRGPDSRKLIDLLMELQRDAPGKVHVLMGNHEAMLLTGDLRYIDPGEIAAFEGDSDPERREEEFLLFRELPDNRVLDEQEARQRFEERFPQGWFARIDAFGPEGQYGMWLLGLPSAIVLDGTLFVHAGLTLDDAKRGIERINLGVREDLLAFLELRDRLVERGVLGRFDGMKVQLERIEEYLAGLQEQVEVAKEGGREFEPPPALQDALELYLLSEGDFLRLDGPLWYRGLARDESEEQRRIFKATLSRIGAKRMVVGHTPRAGGRIESRFKNRLYLIDTGAGPAYRGRISALEIRGKKILEIYLD